MCLHHYTGFYTNITVHIVHTVHTGSGRRMSVLKLIANKLHTPAGGWRLRVDPEQVISLVSATVRGRYDHVDTGFNHELVGDLAVVLVLGATPC